MKPRPLCVGLDSFTTLRPLAERLTAAHLPHLLQMDQNPEMMAQLGGPHEEPETLAYLERNLTHWADHGFGVWILRDLRSGEVVGRACVRNLMLDQRDEVEIGYGFLPAHWGRGWGTEIAQACVDIAFSQLESSSVVGLTRSTNLASQRVLSNVGLVYERDVEFDGLQHRLFRRGRV